MKKLAGAFSVPTDWLVFEDAERGPDEDLRLQFEAMSQLSPEEKQVARAVLEGLLLKHAAHKWSNPATTAAAVPAAAVIPAATRGKRKPAKEAAQ